MPNYLFEHVETEEIVEVFFHMNDNKVYNGKNDAEPGLWKRCYSLPQMAVDAKWDSMDLKKCTEKTGKMRGNMGSLYDKAAELSAERTRIMGHDPLKEKKMEQWSKERGGKKYVDPKAKKDITIEI